LVFGEKRVGKASYWVKKKKKSEVSPLRGEKRKERIDTREREKKRKEKTHVRFHGASQGKPLQVTETTDSLLWGTTSKRTRIKRKKFFQRALKCGRKGRRKKRRSGRAGEKC